MFLKSANIFIKGLTGRTSAQGFCFTLLIFLGIFPVPLTSQETSSQIYTICERTYVISGLTSPSALEKELILPESMNFSGREELDLFILELEQKLHNLRLFSLIETRLIPESSRDDVQSYTLEITLEDAWTFVPLIYPKYETNTGPTLESKILYSNFFGTLMDFEIDSYVEVSPPEERELEGVKTGQWEVETSLGNIHWGPRTYEFQWLQRYDRIRKNNSGNIIEDFTFHETRILTETAFALTEEITYQLAPVYRMRYSYRNTLDEGPMEEEPFALGINQNLILDRMDWIGNFREGLLIDLGVTGRYSFNADHGFKGMAYLDTRWFRNFRERFGLSVREVCLGTLAYEQPDLGIYMRGVADENLYGYGAYFLNSGFSVKSLDWEGVMELQAEPFLDGGITLREKESFSAQQDLRLSSGFSFLFFFDKLTSIQVRTTFGWDLLTPEQDDRFEFLLSTSLFY